MNEDVLRRILEAEAAKVEVRPDALPAIRRRIAARRPWYQRGLRYERGAGYQREPNPSARGFGALVAVAASVAAIAVGVVSCLPPAPVEPPTPADTNPSATLVTPTPGPGVTTPGTATLTPSPAATVPGPAGPTPAPGRSATIGAPPGGGVVASVAVYYQGDDQGRPRLYREFHRLSVGDGSAAARVTTAVREMLAGRTAADPDYGSGWPSSAVVRGVHVTDGVAVVDLSGAAANSADDAEAELAVQQLVWTATAVSGVTGVRVRSDGAPVERLWGRIDVSGTLRRAPAVDVLAPVWLVSPQHGSSVGRTLQVHVAGIVFEATAHLRIRQNGRTVTERVLTLSIGAPQQGETRLDVTLPPGTYVLEAYEISAADGSELHLDDHIVTVR